MTNFGDNTCYVSEGWILLRPVRSRSRGHPGQVL